MFTQKEETRYKNNEFSNMPSIDYYWNENKVDLHSLNKDCIDWAKVKEICDKYGFEYTTINDTFCYVSVDNKRAFCFEFLVYKRIDFSADTYEDWRKNKDYKKMWELEGQYHPIMRKLHECVHELDEQTRLAFETSWAGNVGIFGSHDVKRKTYSFGSSLESWHYIMDRWSPLITDSNSKLKKGVYIFMTSHGLKLLPIS